MYALHSGSDGTRNLYPVFTNVQKPVPVIVLKLMRILSMDAQPPDRP
jgi:hypothetical protein